MLPKLSMFYPSLRINHKCVLLLFYSGTIGERIVFVGDSAGGSFAISVAMKLKQLGLRLPNAILSVYPSLNCKSSGSPSRLTGIVDPILPLGVLLACKEVPTIATYLI